MEGVGDERERERELLKILPAPGPRDPLPKRTPDTTKQGWATLKDSLAVFYKTKHTLIGQSSNHATWYLSNEVENFSAQEAVVDVYSSFVHDCQNSETNKVFFGW